MTLLIDTNVVSEFRKVLRRKAHPAVMAWTESADHSTFHLSVISLHEMEVGARRMERRDPAQGAGLRKWLHEIVEPAFAGRILPVDAAVARRAAALQAPDPKPLADALIAATALVHGLTVVTRNTADFAACGAPTVNPWGAG